MTESTAARCRNVLHIDWEADNPQGFVREDVAQCVLEQGHDKRHQGKDEHGSWFRW